MSKEEAYHITKVVIERPFFDVWNWVSDPLKLPQIYPHWVKHIENLGGQTYKVTMPDGTSHHMKVFTDKELGVIDFDVSPGEISRSRLIPLSEFETLHLHIAVRGHQTSDLFEEICKSTDLDYQNAKDVIEATPRSFKA